MKRSYVCPHCGGTLNPNVKIVLRAEHQGRRELILFSPQPGNYDVTIPETLQLRTKDRVRLSCPICAADLTSKRDENMAEIHFRTDPSGTEGTVVFSRTYGRHETYFVTSEEVKKFGEHAKDDAINFWGLAPQR